jgi:hypothetical protein
MHTCTGILWAISGPVRDPEKGYHTTHFVIDRIVLGNNILRKVFVADQLFEVLLIGDEFSVAGIDLRDYVVIVALKRGLAVRRRTWTAPPYRCGGMRIGLAIADGCGHTILLKAYDLTLKSQFTLI